MAITKTSLARQTDLNAASNPIINVTDPTNPQDAATKNYVDGVAQGLDPKQSVVATTTTNGTLASAYANGQTIDGITLVTGQRILIKDQTTGSENGVYTVNASGAPTRATDFNTSAKASPGSFFFVEQGTANADTGWVLTNDTVVLGTTALVFAQFSGAGSFVAGAGLSRTGNVLNVGATDASILIGADDLAVQKADSTLKTTGAGLAVDTTVVARVDSIITRETPTGAVNGSNTSFTLASAPVPSGSEQVYLNGLLQEPGAGNDYTISTNTITYLAAPLTGDRLRVSYRK